MTRNPRNRFWIIIMMVLGSVMIVVAMGLWGGLGSGSSSSGKTTVVANAPLLAIPRPGETPTEIISANDVPRISLQGAKAAYDAGEAVFLDVRAKSSYDFSHIAGALSIPYDEIEQRLQELDPSDWIIPYCT
jgi:hypothetical protein